MFSAVRSIDVSNGDAAVDIETKDVLRACISARVALAELVMAERAFPLRSIAVDALTLLEARDSLKIDGIDVTLKSVLREQSLQDGDVGVDATRVIAYRNALKARTPAAHARNRPSSWDPLVSMSVADADWLAAHAQTSQTSPARLDAVRSLIGMGLLDQPVLNLSRYFLRTGPDYRRLALKAAEQRDWEPWLLYALNGVRLTARWSRLKIEAIQALIRQTSVEVRMAAPKIYSRELTAAIFAEPYCRIGTLVASGVAKRQTASVYLKALTELGLLEEQRLGRDKAFVHRRYIALLERDDHPVNCVRPASA